MTPTGSPACRAPWAATTNRRSTCTPSRRRSPRRCCEPRGRRLMPHPPREAPGSEPDLQRLLRDLDGIVWVLDAATGGCTFVSDAIRRLLGYAPADWLDDPDFRLRRLHPE